MTDVFGTQTPEPVDPIAYAKEKFKNDQGEIDLAKLAAAKLEADNFIKQITKENEELRGEVKTRIGLEDFLTKVNQPPKNENVPPVPGNQPPNPEPAPVDIEQLVQKHLSNAQAEAIKKANQQKVNDTLAKVWGNDTSKNFVQAAQTLSMSVDELKALAERSPEAFFRVAGVNTQPNSPSTGPVPSSTVHMDPGGTGERDMKYYQNLKKTNPNLYYSPKTQLQMHQDGTRLKERFFN
jgi:hypothetical protein